MIRTIDCHYTGSPGVAAAFLIREGREAAFVETNTVHSVPRLLAALAEAGLGPEAVRWVVVTHIHLDHAGGASALLEACPNAELLAHPRAAPHAIDPSRLIAGAREVYGAERFASLYGDIGPIDAARVRIMEDGEELQWGRRTWRFLHTRGHANHHFVLHDVTAGVVFTGDAFGIGYPAIQDLHPWLFPSTSPTGFDAAAAIESVERVVATGATHAYLTHAGPVGELRVRGDELIRALRWYGRLVDELDASSLTGEALAAACAERVEGWFEEELHARGLGEDARALVALDAMLNVQGVVFAVEKRRFKRAGGRG